MQFIGESLHADKNAVLNVSIFVSSRFSRKIFWCIESLFHEKNTYERHHAIQKAAEHSPFELYHFLQSFFHSAPQVVLQLFILLRDDAFRNYNTGKENEIMVRKIFN